MSLRRNLLMTGVASAAALLGPIGCTADNTPDRGRTEGPAIEIANSEARVEYLIQEGLTEIQATFDDNGTVQILNDTCVGWATATGGYNVVYNPAIFIHETEEETFQMIIWGDFNSTSTSGFTFAQGPVVYGQKDAEGNILSPSKSENQFQELALSSNSGKKIVTTKMGESTDGIPVLQATSGEEVVRYEIIFEEPPANMVAATEPLGNLALKFDPTCRALSNRSN